MAADSPAARVVPTLRRNSPVCTPTSHALHPAAAAVSRGARNLLKRRRFLAAARTLSFVSLALLVATAVITGRLKARATAGRLDLTLALHSTRHFPTSASDNIETSALSSSSAAANEQIERLINRNSKQAHDDALPEPPPEDTRRRAIEAAALARKAARAEQAARALEAALNRADRIPGVSGGSRQTGRNGARMERDGTFGHARVNGRGHDYYRMQQHSRKQVHHSQRQKSYHHRLHAHDSMKVRNRSIRKREKPNAERFLDQQRQQEESGNGLEGNLNRDHGSNEATDTADRKSETEEEKDVLPTYTEERHMPTEHETLPVPSECGLWRKIATNAKLVRPYRRHFTSLDLTDWFLYVSMFTEQFHRSRRAGGRRPVYVDVAANHARRWSNTYFFDRCMGWDGVCVEANPVYHSELQTERHCHVIDTCVSDEPRTVRFSFTDAYGGVVKQAKGDFGVDGVAHATREKFGRHFKGIHTLQCTTLAKELPRLGVGHVDFMSLDVEGYELPVLQGIDWKRTTIDVLVVESKRIEVVTLLQERGYTRYHGVLKDDIYIRRGAPYLIDERYSKWLKSLSKKDYRFHLDEMST